MRAKPEHFSWADPKFCGSFVTMVTQKVAVSVIFFFHFQRCCSLKAPLQRQRSSTFKWLALTWGDVAVSRWRADVRSSGDDRHAYGAGPESWEGQHGGQRSLWLHRQTPFSNRQLCDSSLIVLDSPEGSAFSSYLWWIWSQKTNC